MNYFTSEDQWMDIADFVVMEERDFYNPVTGEVVMPDFGDERFYGFMTASIPLEDALAGYRADPGSFQGVGMLARETVPAPGTGAASRMGWIPAGEPLARHEAYQDRVLMEVCKRIAADPDFTFGEAADLEKAARATEAFRATSPVPSPSAPQPAVPEAEMGRARESLKAEAPGRKAKPKAI